MTKCKITQWKVSKSNRKWKAQKRVVKKVCNGKIKKKKTVHFWQAWAKTKGKSKKWTKAFKARHKCDTAKDPFTPRYQSCKVRR